MKRKYGKVISGEKNENRKRKLTFFLPFIFIFTFVGKFITTDRKLYKIKVAFFVLFIYLFFIPELLFYCCSFIYF